MDEQTPKIKKKPGPPARGRKTTRYSVSIPNHLAPAVDAAIHTDKGFSGLVADCLQEWYQRQSTGADTLRESPAPASDPDA